MPASQQSQPDTPPFRAKPYLVVAVIFLFLMAFLWDADPSFRYLMSSIAFLFIFLALWNNQHLFQSKAPGFAEDFKDDLRTIFSQKKTHGRYTQTQPVGGNPKVIIVAAAFIFFVFFIIFIAVIFLTDAADATADFQQAESFRMSGEYDSAIVYYRKALSSEPEGTETLQGLANSFLAKTTYDSAAKYFGRVMQADPFNEDATLGYAQATYYAGKYAESLDALRDIIHSTETNYDAMELAGHNYYSQNNYDSAIYWYERGRELGAGSSVTFHIMGYIYQTKGMNAKAIEMYKEAIAYDSTNVEIYGRLDELLSGEEKEQYRRLAAKFQQ
jgi:Tfp pilus assembly protein PilF